MELTITNDLFEVRVEMTRMYMEDDDHPSVNFTWDILVDNDWNRHGDFDIEDGEECGLADAMNLVLTRWYRELRHLIDGDAENWHATDLDDDDQPLPCDPIEAATLIVTAWGAWAMEDLDTYAAMPYSLEQRREEMRAERATKGTAKAPAKRTRAKAAAPKALPAGDQ